jgi:hypothetical protein
MFTEIDDNITNYKRNTSTATNNTVRATDLQKCTFAYILYLFFKENPCYDVSKPIPADMVLHNAKLAHIGMTVVEGNKPGSFKKHVVYDLNSSADSMHLESKSGPDIWKDADTINLVFGNISVDGSWLFKFYEYDDLISCHQYNAQRTLHALLQLVRTLGQLNNETLSNCPKRIGCAIYPRA